MGGKVLVGVITFDGEKYCREVFFDNLSLLIQKGHSLCLVTNSGEKDKEDLAEHARRVGIDAVILVNEPEKEFVDILVSNRNKVREYFLAGKWDYLYFLDSDMLGPANAIDALLQMKKNLCAGWYLMQFKTKNGLRILPVVYGLKTGDEIRSLPLEVFLEPQVLKVTAAGLGCCLIHRTVLEKISFRREGGTEDIMFFKDAREKLDEGLWIDTRVKYAHIKYPLGDERNLRLDPRNYRKPPEENIRSEGIIEEKK